MKNFILILLLSLVPLLGARAEAQEAVGGTVSADTPAVNSGVNRRDPNLTSHCSPNDLAAVADPAAQAGGQCFATKMPGSPNSSIDDTVLNGGTPSILSNQETGADPNNQSK